MKASKTIFIFLLVLVFSGAKAQELQARVTVLSNRVATSVDKRIFNTLQTQLTSLLNNRKWTSDLYKPQEKIVKVLINGNKQNQQNTSVK
jgi:hypothetical protein